MSVEKAVIAVLASDGTVTGLVSGRLYLLGNVPQTPTLPFVRVRDISTVRPDHTHDGPSGLARPRIEFRCIAGTYSGAKDLANAVREALVGFKGTSEGVEIGSVVSANERDDYEPDTKRHLRDLDLFVTHSE